MPKGYGLAPYSAAYFYVNVENHVSSSGIPGCYVLGGVFGPAAAADVMNEHHDWWMREGLAIQLEEDGVVNAIAQREGEPLFTVKMANLAADCPDFSGSVKYVSPAGEEAFTLVDVSFSAQLCTADAIGGVEISAPEGDALILLKVENILSAVQLGGTSFVYSKPESR